jgi:predicted metal-dependent phosphoesterase TrpH
MSKINFHFHSYYSDGTHTIPEIAKIINDEDNLKYVCLTDHDTVSGVEELQKLVSKTKIIPGIELTAKYDNNTFFHILGINVNPVKMMHFLMPYGKKYNKKFAKAFNKFKKDNGLVFNLNLNQFQKSP